MKNQHHPHYQFTVSVAPVVSFLETVQTESASEYMYISLRANQNGGQQDLQDGQGILKTTEEPYNGRVSLYVVCVSVMCCQVDLWQAWQRGFQGWLELYIIPIEHITS